MEVKDDLLNSYIAQKVHKFHIVNQTDSQSTNEIANKLQRLS